MRPFFYRRKFVFIPFGIAAVLAFVSFVVMNLWNYLLPGILHVGVITFWQAMGIFVLCKILFGFGKGHRGGAGWVRRGMAEKFKQMGPEERGKFKQKWEQRCGHSRWGHRHDWDNFAPGPEKATE